MGFASERGQTVPLIALTMVILLGFTGIAIDVGFGLLQKRRLQASVDLALLSGARELPNAGAAAVEAEKFAKDNFKRVSLQTVALTTGTSCMESGCAKHDKITMTASTATPTFFARVFGIKTWNVKARGSACGPCDSSPFAYDVVVILDRTYTMCQGSNGAYNNCYDITQAKNGTRELLSFFDPDTDRVSLAVFSSADDNDCTSGSNCRSATTYGRPYSHTTAPLGYSWVTASAASAPYCNDSASPSHAYSGGNGRFYRSAGDFMDGNAGDSDRWVLVDLPHGNNFKNADGSLNENSDFLNTLDCIQHKYWTPIAPSIEAAHDELLSHGRKTDSNGNPVTQVIVLLSDGGANAQPMRRNNDGTPTATRSWYVPSAGHNDRPCADAIGKAADAKADGILIYTIGYAVGEDTAGCRTNAYATEPGGLDGRETLQQIASDTDNYYEQPAPGDVQGIFQAIGHSIVSGGTRLVE